MRMTDDQMKTERNGFEAAVEKIEEAKETKRKRKIS
jgi:hypothetical protein